MTATPRRIETRNARGEVISVFTTTLSDAELAAQDRRAAARREELLATNLAVTSEARRGEQVEREALAGIGSTPMRASICARHMRAWPPRVTRSPAVAASRHVERCKAAAQAANQVLDGII